MPGLASRALAVGLLLLFSSGFVAEAPAQQTPPPDVVYHNGRIVTVNADFDIAEAVAVHDGEFVAVGSDEEVRALSTSGTREVDLGGRTVLPGFVDNHIHPRPTDVTASEVDRLGYAKPGGTPPEAVVDLRYAYTWEQAAERLRARAAEVAPGQWIRGQASRGFFTEEEPPNVFFRTDVSQIPDRHDVDEVVPDHPVVIRASQFVVANSRALELAGIDGETRSAGNGHIERGPDGEPTGILWYDAGDRLEEMAPDPYPEPQRSGSERLEAYRRFYDNLVRTGITSVNIAGTDPSGLRLHQRLQEEHRGTLPRMTAQVWIDAGHSMEVTRAGLDRLEAYGWRTGAGDEWLKLGALKMGLDGGYTFSRPWAFNREPHRHVPGYYGEWRDAPRNSFHVMKWAHDHGWQIGVHVAGDSAAVVVVNQLETILQDNPREDHRHHLIHVEVPPPEETFRKMARHDIGVSLQPNFTYTLQPFMSLALEGERLQRNNPSRTILDHGLHMSYGADERPYGPLIGIYAQVTRRGVDGEVYGPEESVTVEEAIRAYTIDSAWHTFDEDVKGSIEVGKLADMVVLGEDILSVEPERIKEISVVRTIIAGETVYSSSSADR